MTAPYADHDDSEPRLPARPALAAVQGEVQAEHGAGRVQVHLGSGDEAISVWVPDQSQWRSSALSALRDGDFQTWADRTLAEDDADAWERFDPTVGEIETFFDRYGEASGVDAGKPRRSRAGSRNTRRR